MDYKKFFNLDKVSEKSNFFPRVENYSCYVKILNCPSRKWILHNLKGTLGKRGKKNSLALYIENRKVVLKSTKLDIPKIKIKGVIKFLKEICQQTFKDSLIIPKNCNDCIKRNKFCDCKHKKVLNLNKLDVTINQSKRIFEFINDMYLLKKVKHKEPILDKYFEKDVKDKILSHNNNSSNKKSLILKFNILKVDGEKKLTKIMGYISTFCNMINLKRKKEKYSINNSLKYVNTKNMSFLTISDIENLKTTNLIYMIQIPNKFTDNLYVLENNIKPNYLKLAYTTKLTENNFPALRIKIFDLLQSCTEFNSCKNNDDNFDKEEDDDDDEDDEEEEEYLIYNDKTTISIFQTGYLIIAGFKNESKMTKIYEKLLYFFSFVFSSTNYNFFETFQKNKLENKDYFLTTKDFIRRKMEEKWQEEKLVFNNNYKELKFRKSDLNCQKDLFSKRLKIQYEVDLKKLQSDNNSISSFFDETINLYNYTNWEKESIYNWLRFFS